MEIHKINYVWQIYPLSQHNKIQIATILLFHHSNTIGQFVQLVGIVIHCKQFKLKQINYVFTRSSSGENPTSPDSLWDLFQDALTSSAPWFLQRIQRKLLQ